MTRSFVLSGHFFSPAEADPWTGLRHDYSEEENFQQRFTSLSRSCWGANSASRILGPDGKIRRIVNNFRSMAFSFAPGLLDELSHAAPNVYRRILEGDSYSRKNLGHGNALAQCWSPVILPLMEERQIRQQIIWGCAAFEKHFGRAPEGFWLPRQAVNDLVLDVLIEQRIQWILLSPWQADAIMPADEGSWTALGNSPAPSSRPLRLDRPSGCLGVFFQDAQLETGLAGGHLLRDAEAFKEAIKAAIPGGACTTVAADGSLFGWGEPFSDMCLAALWDKIAKEGDVQIVNYGVLWEQLPPTHQVRLRRGEDEQGVSRDCPHGVKRWQADCGCRGGDTHWHQRWRAPLLRQLRQLEDKVHRGIDGMLLPHGIARADWEARVPQLLLRQIEPRAWARSLLPSHASSAAEDQLIRWGWAWHWAQTMLASDLWHDADPFLASNRTGILAPLRCLELVEPEGTSWLAEFLGGLEIEGNRGKTIRQQLEETLMARRRGPEFPAALLIFDRLLRPDVLYASSIGPWQVRDFSFDRQQVTAGVQRYSGRIELRQVDFDQNVVLEYLLLEDQAEGVSLSLKNATTKGKPESFDLEWMPVGVRAEIVRWMGADLEANLASETQSFFPLLRKSLVYSRLLQVPPLPMARSLMELAVTRKILELADSSELPSEAVLASLDLELAFARDYGLQLDKERLNPRFSRWLFQALSKPEDFTKETVVNGVETLLDRLFAWQFQPDITVAQALVYEEMQVKAPALLRALESGHIEALSELRRLLRLAALLQIDTTEIRNHLLD